MFSKVIDGFSSSLKLLAVFIVACLGILVNALVPLSLIVPKTLVPVAQLHDHETVFEPSELCAILLKVKLALTEPPFEWLTFWLCVEPLQVQYKVAL